MQKFHLVWDDKRHSLGIASIDHQHHGLVDLVNALSDAVENGCNCEQARQHMDNILCYAESHFNHEYDLMREHGFPGMEQHTAEHAELLREANTMMQALNPNNPGRAVLITAFLTDCVERHIQKEDVALVQHLREKGLR